MNPIKVVTRWLHGGYTDEDARAHISVDINGFYRFIHHHYLSFPPTRIERGWRKPKYPEKISDYQPLLTDIKSREECVGPRNEAQTPDSHRRRDMNFSHRPKG